MQKPNLPLFLAGGIMLAALTVYGVAALAQRALSPGQQNKKVSCSQTGTEHTVTIKNDRPSRNNLRTQLCDKLTIINDDDQLRLMAFGVHESHRAYNGVTEQTLEKGERMTVTLNETGSFIFHDHLNDEFEGRFTVQ